MPASHPMHAPEATSRYFTTPVQTVARALGMVFMVIGVLGVITGVFDVSALHNVLHLMFGVSGLLASRTSESARSYFLWGGGIYLAFTAGGLVMGHAGPANVVPVNAAGTALALALAIGMITTGVALGRPRTIPPIRSGNGKAD